MAGEPPFYAEIDGKWHELTDKDEPVCGIEVPFGATWTREKPDEVHCGPDAKPKAKAKKG